ncbi:nucleotidyltransferase family protein [Candidatus Magnetominusculus xianensis]|uniref:Nucleotidyltransferase n=1 Tax=Candidatus Magnetominusculus xianensis TaxID=1748249 RepID=A0ABR5SF93_9BACT|nr:nucleotidyltransferase family protein [Candidatus Magnetominusculus xianensis]KWT85574.1 putative nucleotidyltransferase [Candidatus Magnetominusculus xianensis]MBF0404195.1 nucleotidyltransferase family protein [Nitrospirota bacterium]
MSVIEILKTHDKVIKSQFHLKTIGVFGSFARGEAKAESDVDVLVEFEDGYVTFDNYAELKFYLEDLFNREVDLVTMNAIRPQMKEVILREVTFA